MTDRPREIPEQPRVGPSRREVAPTGDLHAGDQSVQLSALEAERVQIAQRLHVLCADYVTLGAKIAEAVDLIERQFAVAERVK